MRKIVLFIFIGYLVFTNSMTATSINRVYTYKEDIQLSSCWLGFQEKYYMLKIEEDSTFTFFINEQIGYKKADTFIYTGTWYKKHDTLCLIRKSSKSSVKINHSYCFRYPVLGNTNCWKKHLQSYEPWQSINLLFIDSLSYIQKIKFPLVLKNNIKNINDYLHFSFNSNTITEEKMIFSLYEKSLLTIPNISQQ